MCGYVERMVEDRPPQISRLVPRQGRKRRGTATSGSGIVPIPVDDPHRHYQRGCPTQQGITESLAAGRPRHRTRLVQHAGVLVGHQLAPLVAGEHAPIRGRVPSHTPTGGAQHGGLDENAPRIRTRDHPEPAPAGAHTEIDADQGLRVLWPRQPLEVCSKQSTPDAARDDAREPAPKGSCSDPEHRAGCVAAWDCRGWPRCGNGAGGVACNRAGRW
mmetsp:Transcript_6879/g.14605  ORF Transcript_6879/g.14605 Transcript_6879/m.14605 type:complete len:216 (-) Transcript_6879:142-789(-)